MAVRGVDRWRRIAAPAGLALVVPEASFSPDGAILAVPVKRAGGERHASRDLIAYRLGDDRARVVDVEVGDFYDIATG